MEAALADLQENLWLYLSLPLVSALVGYVTNVLAIKMMFKPLEFRGLWEPYLGWQGVVPRRAAKMAGIAVDTITGKLITVEEIFDRLDPDRVAEELEPALLVMIEEITDEVMREHQPRLWAALPERLRRRIVGRIQDEAPAAVAEIMQEIKNNIDQLFDLKRMVVDNLVRDKELLNRIFTETGEAEFRFIAHSGAYFGLAFGLIQMSIWIFFKAWWLLPGFGLLVGWATNWLALKMIFHPKEALNIGPLSVQGLFLKRQQEVAHDYGELVSEEILTPRNLLTAVLKGQASDRLMDVIQRNVQQAIDESAGITRPFMAWTVGTANYARLKESVVDHVIERMPETIDHVSEYAEDAMDIRNTLVTRLQGLPPSDFERMLRPAFEEDEWMLIAVGAGLGLAVGFFQLFVLFGQNLAAAGVLAF